MKLEYGESEAELDANIFEKEKAKRLSTSAVLSLLFFPFFIIYFKNALELIIEILKIDKDRLIMIIMILLSSPITILLPYRLFTYPLYDFFSYRKMKCPNYLLEDGYLNIPLSLEMIALKNIARVVFKEKNMHFFYVDEEHLFLRTQVIETKYLKDPRAFKQGEFLKLINQKDAKSIQSEFPAVKDLAKKINDINKPEVSLFDELSDALGGLFKLVVVLGFLMAPILVAGAIGSVLFGSALLGILGWIFLL